MDTQEVRMRRCGSGRHLVATGTKLGCSWKSRVSSRVSIIRSGRRRRIRITTIKNTRANRTTTPTTTPTMMGRLLLPPPPPSVSSAPVQWRNSWKIKEGRKWQKNLNNMLFQYTNIVKTKRCLKETLEIENQVNRQDKRLKFCKQKHLKEKVSWENNCRVLRTLRELVPVRTLARERFVERAREGGGGVVGEGGVGRPPFFWGIV